MNIRINVLEKNCSNELCIDGVEGIIQFADYEETLYIPLDWWSLDDYKLQWQEGLKHLVEHDSSCLVVTIDDPHYRKFIEWWLLYKVGNKIYVRNSIIIADIYEERIGDKPFTVQTCYDFIPDRGEPYNEDGNKISEWVIDWNEVISV